MAVERPDLIRHEAIVHQPEIPITGDVFSSENHMPDLVVEQKIPFEVDRVPSSEEL